MDEDFLMIGVTAAILCGLGLVNKGFIILEKTIYPNFYPAQ